MAGHNHVSSKYKSCCTSKKKNWRYGCVDCLVTSFIYKHLAGDGEGSVEALKVDFSFVLERHVTSEDGTVRKSQLSHSMLSNASHISSERQLWTAGRPFLVSK